jgi:ketosteroid isomerase-like protein
MGLAKGCLRSSQGTSAKTKAKKSENKDKRDREMDARIVGLRLVELTTAGQDATALDELYADRVVSVEIMSDPAAEPQRWEGIQAVREKHEWWENMATVHNVDAEGPFAGNGDDHFVVRFGMDVTIDGQRNQMTEVGLFTVANGKIVKEVYLGLVGTSRQNKES